jgi:hypothetical protein
MGSFKSEYFGDSYHAAKIMKVERMIDGIKLSGLKFDANIIQS